MKKEGKKAASRVGARSEQLIAQGEESRAAKSARTRHRNNEREIKIGYEGAILHREFSDPKSGILYKPYISAELCKRVAKGMNEIAFAEGVEIPTPKIVTAIGVFVDEIALRLSAAEN